MTRKEYVQSLVPAARAATAGTTLFPQTLVSQLILESGYKPSRLATQANNWFGIKSGLSWSGKVISAPTTEYINGRYIKLPGSWKVYNNRLEALKAGENIGSLFRFYPSQTASFRGWVDFLQNNKRYSKVFQAKTPLDQFYELKEAGYATDPNYVQKLVGILSQIKDFFFKPIAGTGLLLAGLVIFWFISKKAKN